MKKKSAVAKTKTIKKTKTKQVLKPKKALATVKKIASRIIPKLVKKSKPILSANGIAKANAVFLEQANEMPEATKFDPVIKQENAPAESVKAEYNLPARYNDNRLVILPRDPWWIHSFWDISEQRINEVISSIPIYERENLKWVLRVYDVTNLDFDGTNANSFFDVDINYDSNSWYINVNQPETSWCLEIGLKNPMGRFFAVARSNVIQTPYFGVSGVIDEEWAVADEDYYKLLGAGRGYDLGKSSFDRRKKIEEIVAKQISSPLASWGFSGAIGPKEQDKFFLEVWTEVILYGRTEPDAKVTVEGKTIKLRPDGTFSLRYALPVGDFQFAVEGVSNSKKHRIKKTPAVRRYDK